MMNPGFDMIIMAIMFVLFTSLMVFHGVMTLITG